MTNQIEIENAQMVAQAAIKSGFRAFLSESRTYGFYTDQEGTRVISFQTDFLSPVFSGNYVTNKPTETGTGWRIARCSEPYPIQEYFNAVPPRWAVKDSEWRYATLEDHLKRYGDSSRYTEVTEDES